MRDCEQRWADTSGGRPEKQGGGGGGRRGGREEASSGGGGWGRAAPASFEGVAASDDHRCNGEEGRCSTFAADLALNQQGAALEACSERYGEGGCLFKSRGCSLCPSLSLSPARTLSPLGLSHYASCHLFSSHWLHSLAFAIFVSSAEDASKKSCLCCQRKQKQGDEETGTVDRDTVSGPICGSCLLLCKEEDRPCLAAGQKWLSITDIAGLPLRRDGVVLFRLPLEDAAWGECVLLLRTTRANTEESFAYSRASDIVREE